MSHTDSPRILLGPQSPQPNLAAALAAAQLPAGPLAVISAGWQEAEGDLDVMTKIAQRPLTDLGLYERTETILADDAVLAEAVRDRQHRLQEQQRLYRMRLKQLSVAARKVLGAEGDSEMLAAEQRHAIAQLRALDRHHLHRCESLWKDFAGRYGIDSHAAIARHAGELRSVLRSCVGVLIPGGHIGVLLNRMRLLGVDRLLDATPIIAWSAGAMVLAERIVLYHDRSPEGRRDAEVLGAGCGIIPGHVFLPDTRSRLRPGDRSRVSLLCRRFAPDTCVALDNGALLRLDGSTVRQADNVRRLGHDGRLAGLRAA